MPQETNELGLSASSAAGIAGRLTNCAVVIPTCNAVPHWQKLCHALNSQAITPDQVLVIDSTSDDETCELVRKAGYNLVVIPRASFRHGATRTLAAALLPKAAFLIYLTQDAIPCDEHCFVRIIECFQNSDVGAAYGRQLPRPEADAIEQHSRLFNYSDLSTVRSLESRFTLGFRAAYFSNSFAAYRRTAFEAVGGFPDHVIVSEDVSIAARMLVAGWNVAYCAEASVYHSHDFSLQAEFSRYFDIAVHHNRERWIIDCFGSVGGEGLRFIWSELEYVGRHAPQLIPLALLRDLLKWVAYQCGSRQHMMPRWLRRKFSLQTAHWDEQETTGTPTLPHNRLNVLLRKLFRTSKLNSRH